MEIYEILLLLEKNVTLSLQSSGIAGLISNFFWIAKIHWGLIYTECQFFVINNLHLYKVLQLSNHF